MATTNREKLAALKDQKASLSSELETLKKERAEARINGGTFDQANRLAAILAELEEIDDAIPLVQRAVDADEARELALVQAERAESQLDAMERMSGEYLDEVAKLEASAIAMSASLASIHGMLPKLSEMTLSMTGQTNEPLFGRPNCDTRLFGRLADVLADDLRPLAAYQAARHDSEKWLPAWADEESRNMKHLLGTAMLRLRQQVAALRASASE